MKIVKESLNEIISFERGKEPLSTLGVGKKALIERWLKEMKFENYIINNNLSIDVNDYVILRNKNLINFPEYIQFNEINGNFSCSNNQLISLRGCPRIVLRDFGCKNNKLNDLEYCPKYVERSFYCFDNEKEFSIEYVKSLCEVGGPIYISLPSKK